MKKKLTKKERIKELETRIEEIEGEMAYTDCLYVDLKEAQAEYKKLTGKEYEY